MSGVVPFLHPAEMEKFQAKFTPIVEGALASPERADFGYFASDEDPSKLRSMTPQEFMKAFFIWLEKKMPVFNSVAANSKVEALGHVTENDLKHVVVRSTMVMGQLQNEKLTVLTIKDYEGKPMVMLPGELMALEILLKRYAKTPE
jgi:aminopeptidase C